MTAGVNRNGRFPYLPSRLKAICGSFSTTTIARRFTSIAFGGPDLKTL